MNVHVCPLGSKDDMMKEEDKFLIGEVTRDEPTCTQQKRKSQKINPALTGAYHTR